MYFPVVKMLSFVAARRQCYGKQILWTIIIKYLAVSTPAKIN